MAPKSLVEFSPSNLARFAAESDDLRRRSDDLCARSRAVLDLAETAVRRGRDARFKVRARVGRWHPPLPAV